MKAISVKDKITVEDLTDTAAKLGKVWQTLADDKANDKAKADAQAEWKTLRGEGTQASPFLEVPATLEWLETVKVSNDVQGVCKVILRDVISTLEPIGYQWLEAAREDYCQQASRAKSQIVRAKSRDSSFQWTGEADWGNLRKPLLNRLHMVTAQVYKLRKLGAATKDYRQAIDWAQLESYHAEANKLGT